MKTLLNHQPGWPDYFVVAQLALLLLLNPQDLSFGPDIDKFFKNVPTPAYFCLFSFFSNTIFTEKTVGFRGIWTRIIGLEGKHADRLTTSKSLTWIHFLLLFKLQYGLIKGGKCYGMAHFILVNISETRLMGFGQLVRHAIWAAEIPAILGSDQNFAKYTRQRVKCFAK